MQGFTQFSLAAVGILALGLIGGLWLAPAQVPPATAVPAPLISAFYSLDNGKTNAYRWLAVDAPVTVTVDATGRPHLGIVTPAPAVPAPGYTFGGGLLTVTTPSQPTQILIDPTLFAFQVAPPKQPGACIVPYGAAAFAIDNQYVYFCSAAVRADGSAWQWSRVPFQASW